MTVRFEPSPNKIWCALNVSNDCVGMVGIEDCFVDEAHQMWNVCKPCAEHERITAERLKEMRRDDVW